jgi:hypothetical protein
VRETNSHLDLFGTRYALVERLRFNTGALLPPSHVDVDVWLRNETEVEGKEGSNGARMNHLSCNPLGAIRTTHSIWAGCQLPTQFPGVSSAARKKSIRKKRERQKQNKKRWILGVASFHLDITS